MYLLCPTCGWLVEDECKVEVELNVQDEVELKVGVAVNPFRTAKTRHELHAFSVGKKSHSSGRRARV